MNLRTMLLCGALSAASLPAADTLTEEFQRALFEEEANRNLPAAIAGYEAVIKRLDEQRQLAATAVFRMGESYRKLGKTNEAVSAYERIIKEFADQETLVKLSGQNLGVLRPAPPPDASNRDAFRRRLQELMVSGGAKDSGLDWPDESIKYSTATAERQALRAFLEAIKSLPPGSDAELAVIMASQPSARLSAELTQVDQARRSLNEFQNQFGSDHPAVQTSQSNLLLLEESVHKQRDAIVTAAEARLAALDRLAEAEASLQGSSGVIQLDPAARARQKELLEQEIALVEGQLKEVRKKVDAGLVPVSEPIGKERELLNLRRKLAMLDESPDSIKRQRELIGHELALVRQLMESTKTRVDSGLVSRNDLVELERQMLQLMREDLDLAGRPAQKGAAATGSALTAEEAEELRRVQGLVANSPDLINAPGTDSLCPLRLAIRNGHVQVFRYLLDHGADVNNQRGSGSSPMHTAAAAGQLVILDELLARSANPSLRDGEGNTPLHRAARLGFVTVAERLLKAGVDIDALRGARSLADEQTPLQMAMAANQVAMVQLLITNRANVSLQSSQLNPPLFLALARVPQFIDTLLEAGANPNGTNTSGTSVLYRAVERAGSVASQRRGETMEQGMTSAVLDADWVAITRKLLDKGANVNAGLAPSVQAPQGESPLFAAVGARSVELVKLLLERGADPNLSVGFGPTLAGGGIMVGNGSTLQPALQRATVPGGLQLVELLLKFGADPNARSQTGDTAMIKAAAYGQVDLAAALLKAGADPNLTNGLGQTPLAIVSLRLAEFADSPTFVGQGTVRRVLSSSVAVAGGYTAGNQRQGVQDPIEDWLALIRLLLAHGAKGDLPMSNEDSTRPLHHAAMHRKDLVQLLLEAKASVSITNRFGHTPLFSAAGANRPEAIRLLVATGVDVNASDIKGNTPLHLAVMRDSMEAAQVLLELGADKSATNKDGLSPARFAIPIPPPGMPTAFDGVLPDYERSAVTGPRPVSLNSKRRVAELFKGE